MLAFGPEHYVPVLKVKAGEKRALPRLAPAVAEQVTPLLEIVVRKRKPPKKKGVPGVLPTVDAHLDTAFKGYRAAVSSFSRYFLDCREMAGDGPEAATKVFSRAAAIGVPFTPVTSIDRTADLAAALEHNTHGLAIRLSKEEFETGSIPSRLPSFIQQHGLSYEEVDLIVDIGAVDRMISVGVEKLAGDFLADVPTPTAWRTLTFSGCAFPASMAGVERNSQANVSRLEWSYWRGELHGKRSNLARLPTFSDCGIQHRDGVEDFDPRTMQASAAIRFAADDDTWLLVKGESMKLKGGAQFAGLAAKVIAASSTNAQHCEGCAGLFAAAGGAPKHGSLQKWRELGTIHHITQTVESLAALPWP